MRAARALVIAGRDAGDGASEGMKAMPKLEYPSRKGGRTSGMVMPSHPRSTTGALMGVLIACICACTTGGVGRVPPSEAIGSGHRFVGVTTRSGEEVPFDPPAAHQRVGGELRPGVPAVRVASDTLYATVAAKPYEIALEDTRELWFDDRRTSWTRTGLLVGGVIGGFWLFVMAAWYWG